MLHDPARHQRLDTEATKWDEARARASIIEIVGSVDSLRPGKLWPIHPRDQDFLPAGGVFRDLYMGAAGAAWACWFLHQEGATPLCSDMRPVMERVLAGYERSWWPDELPPSYSFGKAGILLLARRVLGDCSRDDALYDEIARNVANPTLEACWGASGTMLAAHCMHELTGEDRWREVALRSVDHLWDAWIHDPERDCFLWTQDMYGHQVKHIGAGHGFAGNVYPMLQRFAWLSPGRQAQLLERIERTLVATVQRDGDQANWPQSVGVPRPGRTAPLVQWCHGSPGIITALHSVPRDASPTVETLLRAGGELTWRAGPLAKGPGLCHGTAGNGYALLELFQRTGDERWLTRARHFAMRASQQVAEARREHGVARPTLWTGDLGVALFVWDCVHGRARLPTLDTW